MPFRYIFFFMFLTKFCVRHFFAPVKLILPVFLPAFFLSRKRSHKVYSHFTFSIFSISDLIRPYSKAARLPSYLLSSLSLPPLAL